MTSLTESRVPTAYCVGDHPDEERRAMARSDTSWRLYAIVIAARGHRDRFRLDRQHRCHCRTASSEAASHRACRSGATSRAINLAATFATGEILVVLSAHCASRRRAMAVRVARGISTTRRGRNRGVRVGRRDVRSRQPARPSSRSPAPTLTRTVRGVCPIPTLRFDEVSGRSFRSMRRCPLQRTKRRGREAMARGYCIVHEPAAMVWHPTHSPLASYRRNRAVQAGFALMFPEHRTSGVPRLLGRRRGPCHTVPPRQPRLASAVVRPTTTSLDDLGGRRRSRRRTVSSLTRNSRSLR